MGKTQIEWTHGKGYVGRTWNPLLGCSPVSEGCFNCYAATFAHRWRTSDKSPFRMLTNEGGQFNGTIRLLPHKVGEPRQWREPSMVFVNSQSDLFHPKVSDEFIESVWATMAATPQHVYQVLTKRPERMRDFMVQRVGDGRLEVLPHVWLGTSTENQKWLDRRAPMLIATPAAVRFLSCEPLLGPLDLDEHLHGLDWVINGGESGRGARPFEVAWPRTSRDQCERAGVAFLFKQYGALRNNPDPKDPTAKENGGATKGGRTLDGVVWDQFPVPR